MEPRLVNGRWRADLLPDPPDASAVGVPVRRPGSVRRTAHIEATWPHGDGSPPHLSGRARDLLTPATRADGDHVVVDEAAFELDLDESRRITALTTTPDHPQLAELVGTSCSRGFRARLSEFFDAPPTGTALGFVLDDVPIVSQISSIAWFLPTLRTEAPAVAGYAGETGEAPHQRLPDGRITCSGLRPGGFDQVNRGHGVVFPHFVRRAGDLSSADDPVAWHATGTPTSEFMRRRRRVDVWLGDLGAIEIDAHFRDSVWEDGIEHSVHEYSLRATAHADSGVLIAIAATPRVLPFPECPLAGDHLRRMIGQSLDRFRSAVPETLTELESCTHLNDMLRGIAEAPILAAALR